MTSLTEQRVGRSDRTPMRIWVGGVAAAAVAAVGGFLAVQAMTSPSGVAAALVTPGGGFGAPPGGPGGGFGAPPGGAGGAGNAGAPAPVIGGVTAGVGANAPSAP
jgi:hypothetical protein